MVYQHFSPKVLGSLTLISRGYARPSMAKPADCFQVHEPYVRSIKNSSTHLHEHSTLDTSLKCDGVQTVQSHQGVGCLQVRYWTVVIAVLLVFTATVTPFEIAFLEPALDSKHCYKNAQLAFASMLCSI